ncbi:hypothetical protein SLS56_010999 [Neofusicoccum ribis]|uniref:Arylamine N-acetyltransferase n=1 Tax=Neofusicoccum ribis TaxID=45134 RepID=A0ABR3SD00_9PEZI
MGSLLTSGELERYFNYIGLPQTFRTEQKPSPDIELLTALHTHHISTIPYENLSLHYAKDVYISLDAHVLLEKFLANGRGGYCMEHSIFFNSVLRALGFQVYLTGARPRVRSDGVPVGEYLGWYVSNKQQRHYLTRSRRHVVNIVTLPDGAKWVTDVGFGGDGMRQPMPLLKHHITQNLGPQEVRFDYASIDNETNTSAERPKVWIYQYRNAPEQPWNSFCCFTETEFIHNDFEVMNFYTSTAPDSFQTVTPFVVKFLRRDNGDGTLEISGKLMLVGGDLKENLGGKTRVVKSCRSESERLNVLKDWFGMSFTEEQQAGIKGRVSELLPT